MYCRKRLGTRDLERNLRLSLILRNLRVHQEELEEELQEVRVEDALQPLHTRWPAVQAAQHAPKSMKTKLMSVMTVPGVPGS